MKQGTINLTTVWATLRSLLPCSVYSIESCLSEYKHFYDALVRHHGKRYAITCLKEIGLQSYKVLLGLKPSRGFVKYRHWFKTYDDGFPRRLKKVHRLLISRKRYLNLIGVTICNCYRLLIVDPDYDVSHLETPCSGTHEDGGQDFKDFLDMFDKKVRLNSLGVHTTSLFSGFKGGPYGTPSFRFCFRDAYTLKHIFPKYYDAAYNVFNIMSGWLHSENWKVRVDSSAQTFDRFFTHEIKYKSWYEYFGTLFKNKTYRRYFRKILSWFLSFYNSRIRYLRFLIDGIPKGSPYRLAKFTFLSEGGGKTRVVTSCNFWIQEVLFVFHHFVMRILSKMKTDYTYDQDRSGVFLKWATANLKRRFFSFDLSKATDRFPVKIQRLVVDKIFPGIGGYWETLMGLPIYHMKQRRFVHFKVGQPMGIYSSWPVFALTHHLVVRFCAYQAKKNPYTFRNYAILGDDLVIFDRKVALRYSDFVTKRLGVEISATKSLRSPPGGPRVAEFAKRLFTEGKEVSPLTPKLLAAVRFADPTQIATLIERILVRWSIKVPSQSLFIKELFKRLVPKGRRNKTMSWYTSPKTYPNFLGDSLRDLREQIWKLDSSLGETSHIEMAEAVWIMKYLEKAKIDYKDFHREIFRSLYTSRGLRTELLVSSSDLYHPLAAVAMDVNTRIDQVLEDSKLHSGDTRYLYELLVLIKWYKAFLKFRVKPNGTMYENIRRMSVLRDYHASQDARKAWDQMFYAMQVITQHCEP